MGVFVFCGCNRGALLPCMFVCVGTTWLASVCSALSFSQHRRGVQKEDLESLAAPPCLVPIEGNLVGVELCPFVFFSLPWLIQLLERTSKSLQPPGEQTFLDY